MTALTTIQPQEPSAAPAPYLPRTSMLANPERVHLNLKAADYFAQSDLVPSHYRNKPANCFVAITRAQRLGIDELYFMEKTSVVNGRLVIAAELYIELANGSGRFRGPMTFTLTGEGKTRACTASAVLAATGEVVESTVTMGMAEADGWTRNPKWKSIPDQMLCYRAGCFLTRLYAGGALGGLYSREEMEDITPATVRRIEPVPLKPALPAPAPEPPRQTALLEVKVPGGGSISFMRSGPGVVELLKFVKAADAGVVLLNLELLDTIAEKMPKHAAMVAEIRAKAASDLTPADADEWDNGEQGDYEPDTEGERRAIAQGARPADMTEAEASNLPE